MPLVSGGCAISTDRDAALHDAPASAPDAPASAPDAPAPRDVGARDVPAVPDTPDAPTAVLPTHLVILYWPSWLTGWDAARTADGFEMRGSLAALPTADMRLLTGLAASPAEPIEDTHADVPPSLWTGAAMQPAPGAMRFALHPSIDAVVARRYAESPLYLRIGVRPVDVYAPPMSWLEALEPSPVTVDATAAAALAPCSATALPTSLEAAHSFEQMTSAASTALALIAESFEGGCRHTAALELGGTGTQFGDRRINDIMHEDSHPEADAVTAALAGWVADELARLASAGALDDTLVILTTQVGGSEPLIHDYNALPIFMWSRAPSFSPGWTESTRRPVRDWLHTVALAFGVDAPFAAEGEPGGAVIDEVFSR